MNKYVILLFIIVISPLTNAGYQHYNLTIKELSMGWSGEGVFVWVEGQVQNVDSCTNEVFKLSAEAPLFEQNYSMLLSAYHAGHKVGLYVDGCDGSNIRLKAVRLKR